MIVFSALKVKKYDWLKVQPVGDQVNSGRNSSYHTVVTIMPNPMVWYMYLRSKLVVYNQNGKCGWWCITRNMPVVCFLKSVKLFM